MNKTLLISIIMLFTCISKSYPQERLLDILDSLQVHNKKIKPNELSEVSNRNYFEQMQDKENFALPEYDWSVIYTNSYKQYSIFIIFPSQTFTLELYKKERNSGAMNYLYRDALLFDHEKKLCYLIKYGLSWGGMLLSYDYVNKNKVIKIRDDYNDGINSLIRLNEQFEPLYGTMMETYMVAGFKRKEDEFIGLFEFKKCDDTVYRQLLNAPDISINKITDLELSELFSDKHEYTEYIDDDYEKQDMKKMFCINGMF